MTETVKLTKRTVDTAKPGQTRYVLWEKGDGSLKGFGLRITPSGQKTYVLKCRLKSGEQRWLTIGEHGSPWTPDMAREHAGTLLEAVKKGGDPSSEAKAAKAVPSVAEFCDTYLAEGAAHKKSGTIVADRGRIEHHIKPLLGKVKVDRITKADVTKLFTSVREGKTARTKEGAKKQGRIVVQGGEGVARQCVMLLSTMMTFAIERGLRSDNPAKGFKKPKGKQMERFLSPAEMERLGESLAAEEKLTGDAYPAAAIRLLALTGCRRNEIEKLEWRHVAWELAQLHLPDSKTGKKAVYLNAPHLRSWRSLKG